MTAGPRKLAAGPAAPQPWPSLMDPVSQRTAALCGRLAWRRQHGLAADQELPDDGLHKRAVLSIEGAASLGEPGVAGARATPSSTCDTAVSSVAGLHAATDCSDDGPATIVKADGEADMARVQQLVDEICSDLERGSPDCEATSHIRELSKVRLCDTAGAPVCCPCKLHCCLRVT